MLIIGTDKSPILDTLPESYLFIGSDQLSFPKRRRITHFDVSTHHLDILPHGDHRKARAFARLLYAVSPQGENTLTVRNGRRALAKLILNAETLDLPRSTDPANIEANGMIDDLLFTPEMRQVFTGKTNFPLRGIVVADLAELDEDDQRVLGAFLAMNYEGTVVVPDFGFYATPLHTRLIREHRLIAGVNALAELPELRHHLLLMEKRPSRCTFEDAEVLASYEGLIKGTNVYNDFIQRAVGV